MSSLLLLRAAVLGCIALTLNACGGDQAPAASAPPNGNATPVTIALADLRAVPVYAEAVGNVEALASVAIKSQVDGQIAQVLVRDGQDVDQGALLFQLDARPFEIQLRAAQAGLARDAALRTAAVAQEARYRDLLKQGFVTPDGYAQVKGNLDTLEAAVQTDQGSIDSARLRLEYSALRAPMRGRLGKIALQAGNLVKANDTAALVTLNQLDPVYVSFSLREQLLPQIRAAQARGATRAEVRVPGSNAPAVGGGLSFVDNAVDAGTGTIRLRATFANAKDQLWPGQFVNIRLHLGEDRDALVIPLAAVQTGPQGTYVYVIGADAKAEQRSVSVSRSTAELAIIGKGLRAGERVVVDGQSRIAPGASVAVQAQK